MNSSRTILVVNPNTTATMTDTIAAVARRVAAGGTDIIARNPRRGPPSIEGYFDEALAVPGVLEVIGDVGEACQGVVIACFDDTGLDAARCITKGPVVGIGEAAFHCASLVCGRFSVITTLSRSVPAIQHNLVRYGLASRCASVRASEVPVLDLERHKSAATATILAAIADARSTDGCEAIVLGCAGMADLADELSRETGIPVIDGVGCAVKLVEALLSLGLTTSRSGGYAAPLPKNYS